MGGGDQGVCKEDVSGRLEGLAYRIHLEPNRFFSHSDPSLKSSSSLFCHLFLSPLLLLIWMLSCFHAELWFDVFFLSSVCCRFAEQTSACALGNTAAGRGQSAPWTVA